MTCIIICDRTVRIAGMATIRTQNRSASETGAAPSPRNGRQYIDRLPHPAIGLGRNRIIAMIHIQAAVTDTVESLLAALPAGGPVDSSAGYHVDEPTVGVRGRVVSLVQRKYVLQFAILVAAVAPVAAGAWGVVAPPGETATGLSSHARYLSGLLFAIGLGFWSTVPRIEHKSERFRLLTVLVVIGGLCRLAGVAAGDALSLQTVTALGMELCVTPLLCFWQGRTARTAASPP